jgi:hypothetical protein
MKRILLTTTSLVLAAGVAQAEVTFSGKAEAGVSRTAKTAAVAVVAGRDAEVTGVTALSDNSGAVAGGPTLTFANSDMVTTATTLLATADADAIEYVNGVLTHTKAAINTSAASAVTAGELTLAKASADDAALDVAAKEATLKQASTEVLRKAAVDALNLAKAQKALADAYLAALTGTAAKAAVKAGDMVAYSGYDLEVAVSSTLDNGMVVSAGFDMGAGSIADRDDDRVLDAQAAAVALSAVTIKNGGVTYVIGQDKIDDLYDDTQNGDVSVSGAMGGISYTLVADLDKDTKAVAASTKYTVASSSGAGDSTFVETAAVAAVHESTSLKLSGAAGGVTWSFTTTNKDDFGDAASLVSLGYAAGDALSFTLKHDTDGAAEAINTLSATYTMDAISLTVSAADDKNHARNTNTGGKASQNMTIAYANGPLSASFNNDESSAWWATTSYDLGNGADIFATVDHQEFAVVGLTFAF